MLKRITYLASAFSLAMCHSGHDVVEEQQKEACFVFEKEQFIKWDLRPLESTESADEFHTPDYKSQGLSSPI